MNIKVTDEAKKMIQKTLSDKDLKDPVVRVYIAGFG